MPTEAQWKQIKWIVLVYLSTVLFVLVGSYLIWGKMPLKEFLHVIGYMSIFFFVVGLARYNYPDEEHLPASKEVKHLYIEHTLITGIILTISSVFLVMFSQMKLIAIISLVVGILHIWYSLRKKN